MSKDQIQAIGEERNHARNLFVVEWFSAHREWNAG